MANPITFTENTLDSRDIIERFEELKEIYERHAELDDMEDGERDEDEQQEYEDLEYLFDGDECDEYCLLKAFIEAVSDYYSDWQYGVQFIHDSYFTEYAQQLAEDIGAIARDVSWPSCHIDWEDAADSLKIDYTSYNVADTTYWARS